jgi:trimethylamine--corrinoid protein Co-methyltransferase
MTAVAFLSKGNIADIHSASYRALEMTGIAVKNRDAKKVLQRTGCSIETDRVRFPADVIDEALSSVPSSFTLTSRDGDRRLTVGGKNTIFNPGSSAADLLDPETHEIRRGTSLDLARLTRLADALPYIEATSTALIASDVPESISDLYRLFVVLQNSDKPIITGAFTKEGVVDMVQMLEAVVGGKEELRKRPRAIFDCCPTSPMTWNDVSSQNLMDCAANGVPAEIVPAPMMGATSPMSIFGTLVQSNAETLAGIVIAQSANPGTPIVYGGSLAAFDMKNAMICLGAIETSLAAVSAAQMGKHYRIPTHAYLGLSESKRVDSQSGFESAISLILAAMARINIVSGPGMLAFENCQSPEKLVIDNEICGMAKRLIRGVEHEDFESILDLMDEIGPGGNFLSTDHTLGRFRQEQFLPSEIICRRPVDSWRKHGSTTTESRAATRAEKIVHDHIPKPLPQEAARALQSCLDSILRAKHIDRSAVSFTP